MSQPADAPDGNDPRIVTPSEDERKVITAHGYSTGKTYHTRECPTVKRMDDPTEVPISIARWKDYTKCKRCDEHARKQQHEHVRKGPRNGGTHAQLLSGVDAPACLQIRALLLSGETQQATADILGIGKATVGTHARGECGCEHHGRPLTYDGHEYLPVKGDGVPKHITGFAPIPEQTCEHIRRVIVREGVSAVRLATVLGVSDDSIRHHAHGECDHGDSAPAASFDADEQAWTPGVSQ